MKAVMVRVANKGQQMPEGYEQTGQGLANEPIQYLAKTQITGRQPVAGSKEANNTLSDAIRRFRAGEMKSHEFIPVGTTPAILVKEAKIPDLPIVISQKVAKKANAHGISDDGIALVGDALSRPMAVFDSPNGTGHVTVLSGVSMPEGEMTVALDLTVEKGDVLVNDVRTIHPRAAKGVMIWFSMMAEGNILPKFLDKEKSLQWLGHSGRAHFAQSQDIKGSRKNIADLVAFVKGFGSVATPETEEPTSISRATPGKPGKLSGPMAGSSENATTPAPAPRQDQDQPPAPAVKVEEQASGDVTVSVPSKDKPGLPPRQNHGQQSLTDIRRLAGQAAA